MQVVRGLVETSVLTSPSGGRVSNAWVTCPKVGDNPGKPGLIPHVDMPPGACLKAIRPLWDGPASHQLVGEVTAHQGNDG